MRWKKCREIANFKRGIGRKGIVVNIDFLSFSLDYSLEYISKQRFFH